MPITADKVVGSKAAPSVITVKGFLDKQKPDLIFSTKEIKEACRIGYTGLQSAAGGLPEYTLLVNMNERWWGRPSAIVAARKSAGEKGVVCQ